MKHEKVSPLGNVILEEMCSLRPCDFANSLSISKTHLNHLIRGDRKLTVRMAKRLAGVTHKSAREWLELEWGELDGTKCRKSEAG